MKTSFYLCARKETRTWKHSKSSSPELPQEFPVFFIMSERHLTHQLDLHYLDPISPLTTGCCKHTHTLWSTIYPAQGEKMITTTTTTTTTVARLLRANTFTFLWPFLLRGISVKFSSTTTNCWCLLINCYYINILAIKPQGYCDRKAENIIYILGTLTIMRHLSCSNPANIIITLNVTNCVSEVIISAN